MIAQLEKHPVVTQYLGAIVSSASAFVSYAVPVLQAASAVLAFVSACFTVAFQIRQWRRGRVVRS